MCFLFLLSIVCFVFNDLRYELVLHYVDIAGIVDTHDLAFLFNNPFMPMSTIFLLDFQTVPTVWYFRTVPTVWYFSVFHFILKIIFLC